MRLLAEYRPTELLEFLQHAMCPPPPPSLDGVPEPSALSSTGGTCAAAKPPLHPALASAAVSGKFADDMCVLELWLSLARSCSSVAASTAAAIFGGNSLAAAACDTATALAVSITA